MLVSVSVCLRFIHHSFNYRFIYPSIYPLTHPSIHPPISPSIHLSIHSSIHPFIHSSIHPPLRPSIYPNSIHPSTHPPIPSSLHPFIHPSIHPSIHLSIYYFQITWTTVNGIFNQLFNQDSSSFLISGLSPNTSYLIIAEVINNAELVDSTEVVTDPSPPSGVCLCMHAHVCVH